jgi:hypothetical protein
MDGSGDSDEGHLGHAARAPRAVFLRVFDDDGDEALRDVLDGGDQVGAEGAGQRIAVALDEMLGRGPTQGLDDAAFDLPLQQARIDRLADVVGAGDFGKRIFAGQRIDDDFGGNGDVAVGEVGVAGTGVRVDLRGLRREIGVFRFGRAFLGAPFFQRRLPPRRARRCRS